MHEPLNDLAEQRVPFVSADGHEFFFPATAFSSAPVGPPRLADELVRKPPVWLRELIERGDSLADLVRATGHAALTARTREERQVVARTLDLLTLTAGARQLISYTIGDAIRWALEVDGVTNLFLAPITVYDNEDIHAPGPWASLSAWEMEMFYPAPTLQLLQLNQAISAVRFHPKTPTFAELFLFEQPTLQGSFVRIVQERSLQKPPHVVLTTDTLNNQARSLLGSVHLVPGRRYSAADLFMAEATARFVPDVVAEWGTLSLVHPPVFSWWPHAGFDDPPKPTFAWHPSVRLRFDFHIDDMVYGPVDGWATLALSPSAGSGGHIWIPQPWLGSALSRWGGVVFDKTRRVLAYMIQKIQHLAPGATTVRILPGRSLEPGYSAVFPPPGPRPPQVTTGSTTDDVTIALAP